MRHRQTARGLIAAASAPILGLSVALSMAGPSALANAATRPLHGTVWVANRGDATIRGFEASSGVPGMTVAMRPGSQPGDLAYAKGKLYVAEEFGVPPGIAIVDETGQVVNRIPTGPRPHHVHASVGGNLVAYGVFGTNGWA